jgi:histidine decarboxylase
VTVVFERPSLKLVHKWQLAVHHEWAHIITMPHVTREMIDEFANDLAQEGGEIPNSNPKIPRKIQ